MKKSKKIKCLTIQKKNAFIMQKIKHEQQQQKIVNGIMQQQLPKNRNKFLSKR